jgi:hypothetical protein
MKELGLDDKGRKIVRNDDGTLSIVLPTGQSVTFSRKHIVRVITEAQAEVDKWTRYLALLDAAVDAEGG